MDNPAPGWTNTLWNLYGAKNTLILCLASRKEGEEVDLDETTTGPNEALLSPFDDVALFLSTLIRAIVAILRGKLFCLNTVFIKQTISQFRHYFHPIWFYQLLDSLVTLFGRKL